MEQGTVKWFDDAKGYGFIVRDNGKSDAFAHYREIVLPRGGRGHKSLQEGDRVSFEVTEGAKGPAAKGIQKLET